MHSPVTWRSLLWQDDLHGNRNPCTADQVREIKGTSLIPTFPGQFEKVFWACKGWGSDERLKGQTESHGSDAESRRGGEGEGGSGGEQEGAVGECRG
eukprot:2638985-Rhodomonas_salina.3